MPSKEDYCYKILKKYSLIVDFEGTPTKKRVPPPIYGETYGQWKNRVLGDDVTNVVLYVPTEPAHQKRISTLQNQAGAESLEKTFLAFGKAKDNQKKTAISAAIENTERKYETFSKDTLEQIFEDSRDILEPSVIEFFQRFLDTTNPNIDSEKLISDLMKAYNNAVRIYRERG